MVNVSLDCPSSSYPAIYPGVVLGIKAVTGVACLISIACACWIVITYCAFKDLRTTARQLLVNLSIADIMVASSHLFGTMVNYERFLHLNESSGTNKSINDPLCVGQASVTMFSSIASFLWSMCIAVYMLSVTVSIRKKSLKRMVVMMYLISWGVPIPFVITGIATKTLGFQYTGETGCYTISEDTIKKTVILEVISYEMWVYLAYIFLPVVYLTVFCYIRRVKAKRIGHHILAVTKADLKLLLIPVAFLLLRIWTTINDVFAFYETGGETGIELSYRCHTANAVLLFFQAIGINSQGTVNAILFCVLTKQVRIKWWSVVSRPCRKKPQQKQEEQLEDTLLASQATNVYGSTNYTE